MNDNIILPFSGSDLFWPALVLGGGLLAYFLLIAIRPAKDPLVEPLKTLQARFGLGSLNPALFLIAALLWGCLFLTLFTGLLWMIWQVWWADFPGNIQFNSAEWRNWRFSLAKFTALTAVLGAVLAFPITLIRLSLSRHQNDHADNVLFNERVRAASADLFATRTLTKTTQTAEGTDHHDIQEDDITRRNIAIDTLEALVAEHPSAAQRIARLLSAYVREMSREHPPEPVPDGLNDGQLLDWVLQLTVKRTDMQSAVQSLGRIRHKYPGPST